MRVSQIYFCRSKKQVRLRRAIIINSKEMNIYKTDFRKVACYEAPSVTVFNVVAENGFCDSGSKPSNANSDDPEDFEFGGMFY